MVAPLEPLSRDEQWVEDVVQAPHDRFSLDREGYTYFDDEKVGRLTRGSGLLLPEVKMLDDVDVGAGAKARITTRLVAFSRDVLSELFDPIRAESRETLSGAARGLLYQLEQELGTLACADADAQLRALTPRDRRILKGMGVRAGVRYVYMTKLLDARALKIRRAFVVTQRPELAAADPPTGEPPTFSPKSPLGKRAARRLGYVLLGPRAVRVDVVESVLATPKRDRRDVARMAGWLDCPEPVADQVLRALFPASGASRNRSARRRRGAGPGKT
jgi:ATP-dependent RNA helicase SUPV3L1/SUV3